MRALKPRLCLQRIAELRSCRNGLLGCGCSKNRFPQICLRNQNYVAFQHYERSLQANASCGKWPPAAAPQREPRNRHTRNLMSVHKATTLLCTAANQNVQKRHKKFHNRCTCLCITQAVQRNSKPILHGHECENQRSRPMGIVRLIA